MERMKKKEGTKCHVFDECDRDFCKFYLHNCKGG
eukprot:COSAG06_NODE_41495_length_390_cov_168.151203_2_plen_33_part_01